MSAIVKTSACVDCATPIIGEQLRCPACHDRHAVGFLADVGDEDMTTPRDRAPEMMSTWQSLVAWLGAALIVAAIVVFLMFAGRGCQ